MKYNLPQHTFASSAWIPQVSFVTQPRRQELLLKFHLSPVVCTQNLCQV